MLSREDGEEDEERVAEQAFYPRLDRSLSHLPVTIPKSMAHEQVGLARPLLASTAQKWRAERPRTELTSWCALGRRANFVGNSHLESDCCGSTRKSASLIDERRCNQEVEHQREVDKRERERAGEGESDREARNGSGRKNWLSAGQIWPPLLFRSFSCCCCCCCCWAAPLGLLALTSKKRLLVFWRRLGDPQSMELGGISLLFSSLSLSRLDE